MNITTKQYNLELPTVGSIALTVNKYGEGRPYLVLHGGGGPQTVQAFANKLANEKHVQVLVPIHPGFALTNRPEKLTTIKQLAELYNKLLDTLNINNVVVIGNSLGGWIAAEMSLFDSKRVSCIVLVDAVGIDVPEHPVVDFFSLSLEEVAKHSYYDPLKFAIDPAKLPPAVQAAMPQNRATLKIYSGGPSMSDPTLKNRLASVFMPVLVLWGEGDKIVDQDYEKAFAKIFSNASFEQLNKTGHMPQIETPDQLIARIWEFSSSKNVGGSK
jgi:pimeloyl-ACP methyl ester carboxylesterase